MTKRGLIEWKNHKYFHLELLNHQGKEVVVGVDIHNADFVQVRTLDGRFICNAEFEAHKKAAFPVPMVEQQRENRAKGRLNRIKHRENEALEELNPVITIEHQINPALKTVDLTPKKEPTGRIIFTSQAEKDDYLAQQKQKKVG